MKKIIFSGIFLLSMTIGAVPITKKSIKNTQKARWCKQNWNRWYFTQGCSGNNKKECAISNCIQNRYDQK